uniref:Uncharacterized protein n=1 Tax=Anguilla anguilla TaxID=7936 RepID=A0A0E9WCV1_ANGAN
MLISSERQLGFDNRWQVRGCCSAHQIKVKAVSCYKWTMWPP